MSVDVKPSSGGVQSVGTALKILAEVASHDTVGVTELSKTLDVPKSSVQRMLYTLQDAGWVREAGGDVTRWMLTTKMLRFTGNRQDRLRRIALPVMERLRTATQETVHLAVQEHDEAVIVERLVSPQAVRANVDLGQAAPLAASANGKAILATWSPDEVAAFVERGLQKYTDATIVDPSVLLEELELTRGRGYATNGDEWREGVSAVAVPIETMDARAEAAISISVPSYRMDEEKRDRYGLLLVEALRTFDIG